MSLAGWIADLARQIAATLACLFRRPCDAGTGRSNNAKVQHVVVLMLENRSFDHLLGNLKSPAYPIDGLTGNESNYTDPVAKSGKVSVTRSAPYVPDVDPGPSHEFQDVMLQLFCQLTIPSPIVAHNHGFAYDYGRIAHDMAQAGKVMQCFGPGELPALHALAQEFAVCDRWFSSLPGPTWPNRFFIHCATSGGFVDDALRVYDMPTIFERLTAKQVSWRVYYHDVPQSLALLHQRQYLTEMYEEFDAFLRDCENDTLPAYSFIEPRYFNEGADRANDQHPIHGVALGDTLIADVYEALRRSPAWNETLLLIAWDEHGGFFDHALPPACVNPDGNNAPEFAFNRLGVRIPAVIVSPHVPRGTIDSTLYEHASVPATLRKLFDLGSALTKRDAAANTFERVLSLPAPRTDTPLTLRRIAPGASPPQTPPEATAPTNVHASLVALVESLDTSDVPARGTLPKNEAEASRRANDSFSRYRRGKALEKTPRHAAAPQQTSESQ